MTATSEPFDPDYSRHGGFPDYGVADAPPGFARFVSAMRQLQDLAVSAAPDEAVWADAADRVGQLVDLLGPFERPEGVGPAGRAPALPGMGSVLLPPWTLTAFEPNGVEMRGHFSRYHVGGNSAVHGGVLPLLFDHLFGMVVHAAGQPISRTAFLHIDYRKVTPIDVPLTMRGRVDSVAGRKAFVSAELTDSDDRALAEAHGLMVRLLAGQP
ncbi:MAG TPA: PaaI family thioesterase [Mycobacterium sp.]|nr:PaaI family thioesterase [Mycobacterium sp.]